MGIRKNAERRMANLRFVVAAVSAASLHDCCRRHACRYMVAGEHAWRYMVAGDTPGATWLQATRLPLQGEESRLDRLSYPSPIEHRGQRIAAGG